jgi:hypothetical protein
MAQVQDPEQALDLVISGFGSLDELPTARPTSRPPDKLTRQVEGGTVVPQTLDVDLS